MNPRRSHLAPRPAFTLIELMLAVLLLALLTASAALSFSGPLRRARARDAVEALRSFDAQARLLAIQRGRPVRVAFDLANGAIARRDASGQSADAARVAWPTGFAAVEVRVGEQLSRGDDNQIDISPLGVSPTYAVHVTGPQFDRWIIVAGLTGQIAQVQDESTMASLISRGGHFPGAAAQASAGDHAG